MNLQTEKIHTFGNLNNTKVVRMGEVIWEAHIELHWH